MADSTQGNNVLCHTLIPNVTVDFQKAKGNVISVRWQSPFRSVVPEWQVYLHDKYEHLVLASYAMKDLPFLNLRPVEVKARGKISPRLTKRPRTKAHPCSENPGYSQNSCYLDLFWGERIRSLREFYGSRFDCVIPGILTDHGMPLCTKDTIGNMNLVSEGSNETVGYTDLINIRGAHGSIVRSKKGFQQNTNVAIAVLSGQRHHPQLRGSPRGGRAGQGGSVRGGEPGPL